MSGCRHPTLRMSSSRDESCQDGDILREWCRHPEEKGWLQNLDEPSRAPYSQCMKPYLSEFNWFSGRFERDWIGDYKMFQCINHALIKMLFCADHLIYLIGFVFLKGIKKKTTSGILRDNYSQSWFIPSEN